MEKTIKTKQYVGSLNIGHGSKTRTRDKRFATKKEAMAYGQRRLECFMRSLPRCDFKGYKMGNAINCRTESFEHRFFYFVCKSAEPAKRWRTRDRL